MIERGRDGYEDFFSVLNRSFRPFTTAPSGKIHPHIIAHALNVLFSLGVIANQGLGGWNQLLMCGNGK